jgi:hypothetical protein
MVIARTTFTVQSTALSGVGVLLSVGAGLFLVAWWTRHAWKARRATRVDDRRHARGRADGPLTGDAAPRERTPVLAPGQPTGS